MEAEYQKTLSHSCLILKERGTCSPDSYEMRILAANRIEGLLPVTEEYVDNELRFRYDVTGLKPFGVYCERRHFRTEDLCCLFEGLLDLLERTEEYLLHTEHLVLDPDYLYVSWEEGRLQVPYLPAGGYRVRQGLTEITEYLIRKTEHGDHGSMVLACRFLHALQEPDLQIRSLRELLAESRSVRGLPEDEVPEEEDAPEEEDYLFPEPILKDIRGENGRNGGFSGKKRGSSESGSAEAVRRFLPEKQDVVMLAVLIPAALLLYAGFCVQRLVILTVFEKRVLAAAFAAAVLLGTVLTRRLRSRTSGEGAGAGQEAHGAGPGGSGFPGEAAKEEESGASFWEDGDPFWFEEDPVNRSGPCEYTVPLAGLSPDGGRGGETWLLVPEDAGTYLKTVQLFGEEILIGQEGGGADCVIPDETVSRIHAKLTRRGDIWYVRDMNSRNGTSVDEKKPAGTDEVPAREGSRICFARCAFILTKAKPPGGGGPL